MFYNIITAGGNVRPCLESLLRFEDTFEGGAVFHNHGIPEFRRIRSPVTTVRDESKRLGSKAPKVHLNIVGALKLRESGVERYCFFV